MSLKVWLPLNGNLKQQGTSKITVVNNGATISTDGKIGSCYTFNGSTSYISLSGTELFQIFTGGQQQFTIAMWIYHSDTTRGVVLGDYQTTGTTSTNLVELGADHYVRFFWAGGHPDLWFANSIIGGNKWVHIATVYDGTKVQLYINGVPISNLTGTLQSMNKTTGEFRLGRDNRSDNTAFNGKINDLRIYDHALSTAEVQEIAQGLILHYKLDNISSSGSTLDRITDSSGYGNHGEIVGELELSTNVPRYQKSIYITSGDTNYIVSKKEIGNPPDAITMNIWAKFSTAPVGKEYHSFFNIATSTQEFEFGVHQTGFFRQGVLINGTRYAINSSNLNLIDGQWHMYTMTYNGANIYRYVDGVLRTEMTQAATGNLNGANCKFLIGHYGSNTSYRSSNAYFSDARIYATALDADAIRQLYEVSAKVDNKQNIHTFELVENDNTILITKKGHLKCSELEEEDGTTKFFKTDKTIHTQQIVEN